MTQKRIFAQLAQFNFPTKNLLALHSSNHTGSGMGEEKKKSFDNAYASTIKFQIELLKEFRIPQYPD